MSATWGKNFRVTIFGESHGDCIGVVIDGIPSGTVIDIEYINREMKRRAPGQNKISTLRKEDDTVEIISGIFEGRTTGAPFTIIIKNRDHISKDYSKIKDLMRPGHADYTSSKKYKGFNDYRGSGHFSGRITAPLVFAGTIARQILEQKGIYIGSHIESVESIVDNRFEVLPSIQLLKDLRDKRLPLIKSELEHRIIDLIDKVKKEGDSVGGVVECAIIGINAGVGDPFFESVESVLSSILFSIPSIKGVEFGSGFEISKMKGSQANDEFFYADDGSVRTKTNNNGGINGGITNGMPIVFRVAVKPPSSIARVQDTINISTYKNQKIEVTGRHDPIIVPRIIPVIEAVSAIAVLDMIMGR